MKTASIWLLLSLASVAGLAGCKNEPPPETAAEAEPKLPPSPSGTMSLQGYYSLADPVGTFQVCGTGQHWRVSPEGDHAALEEAYRRSGVPQGSGLLVEIEGGIDSRPSPDRPGTEVMLIVARFVRAAPGEPCPGE